MCYSPNTQSSLTKSVRCNENPVTASPECNPHPVHYSRYLSYVHRRYLHQRPHLSKSARCTNNRNTPHDPSRDWDFPGRRKPRWRGTRTTYRRKRQSGTATRRDMLIRGSGRRIGCKAPSPNGGSKSTRSSKGCWQLNHGPGTDPPTTSLLTWTKPHCLMGICGTV